MRVACLQFGPELGKVKENMEKADAILARTRLPADLDWLVLPEMAFSGMKFDVVYYEVTGFEFLVSLCNCFVHSCSGLPSPFCQLGL